VPGGVAAQKKSLIATERDEAARAAWQETVAAMLPEDLVFVDETSTHTALTRRRARAPRGQRAIGRAPRNHGSNITLLATLTPDGIGPALSLTGGVTGAAFAAYAARCLAPSLRPGQVVILDNLSAHKSEDARTAIEAVGAKLLFLPAYSPDFNPIELAFAKIKERLRAAAARSADDLLTATAAAIDAVSAADAQGFYQHCGFTLKTD
jgi:transposase